MEIPCTASWFSQLWPQFLPQPPHLFAQQPAAVRFPRLQACRRPHAPPLPPSIAEKIRAHVRFLSLDLLEGRGPGKRGGELAAEYIATQFALAGVEPAGDNGTYFQRVPLVAVHTIEDKTKFSLVPATGQPIDLAYGAEIVSKDQTGQTTADFDAPIVYVGYGINAPGVSLGRLRGPERQGHRLEGQDRPRHRQ